MYPAKVLLGIGLIFFSCIASGFSRPDVTDWRYYQPSPRVYNKLGGYQLSEDKLDPWRTHSSQKRYVLENSGLPRPPPYYSYTTYVRSPPTYKKQVDPEQPTVKILGSGISGATECAPGIPKCTPRLGR